MRILAICRISAPMMPQDRLHHIGERFMRFHRGTCHHGVYARQPGSAS